MAESETEEETYKNGKLFLKEAYITSENMSLNLEMKESGVSEEHNITESNYPKLLICVI